MYGRKMVNGEMKIIMNVDNEKYAGNGGGA